MGVHLQNDGKFYVGIAPTVGRVNGKLLSDLADLVEAHGSSRAAHGSSWISAAR